MPSDPKRPRVDLPPVGLAEYALILLLIAVVAVVALFFLGQSHPIPR